MNTRLWISIASIALMLMVSMALMLTAPGDSLAESNAQLQQNQSHVPAPKIDLSDPNYGVYTLYDRAQIDGPITSITLKLDKRITIGISNLGSIRNGELNKIDNIPNTSLPSYTLDIIFELDNVKNDLNVRDSIYKISISNMSINPSYVFMKRSSEKEYCDLSQANYGLKKILNRSPQGVYTGCSPVGIEKYYSGDFDTTEDIIVCFPPAFDRRNCGHSFHIDNMNITAFYAYSDLQDWQVIKQEAIDLLVRSTQSKETAQ